MERTLGRNGRVRLSTFSSIVCTSNDTTEVLHLLEDPIGQWYFAPTRSDVRHSELIPHVSVDMMVQRRSLWSLCSLCSFEQVSDTVDEVATARVKLGDGQFKAADSIDVWIFGHDEVEEAGYMSFRTLEMLR